MDILQKDTWMGIRPFFLQSQTNLETGDNRLINLII
jgi:hypothetical protein